MVSEFIIDGRRIRDYDGFVHEFNRGYAAAFGSERWDGLPWDGEISDLHELLEAAEEAADLATGERLSIRWLNSRESRSVMGHEHMVQFWTRSLERIPESAFSPASYQLVCGWQQERLRQARAGEGRTLFEYLVWQIRGDDDEDVRSLTDLILE